MALMFDPVASLVRRARTGRDYRRSCRQSRSMVRPLLTIKSGSSCCPVSSCDFGDDLCSAFVAANIPLDKLDGPILASFLKKYMYNDRQIPS